MSADANKLCIITKEGKAFQVVGDMLNVPNWFKWSNEEQVLAFINGEGRFATENKKFTLKEIPVLKNMCLRQKASQIGISLGQKKITSSFHVCPKQGGRMMKKEAAAFLYSMNVKTNKQSQFTFPQKA